jgi:Mrp family chromosome partitioning ATPase
MLSNEYIEETRELRENLAKIKRKVIVMSGKGGVGKSTISANLAGYMSIKGLETGLLDIDLHGPSIPRLLGLTGKTIENDGRFLIPLKYNEKLKVVSIGNLLESESSSVIWRGPRKHSMIRQFLKSVNWGALDYLVVDSPPGTGDEQLSIIQSVENFDGAVIVTTPQDIALSDVKKSIDFCRQLKVPIIGIIENMSGFVCPKCRERIEIFKSGGGRDLAEKENIPFLGFISIDVNTPRKSDAGTLVVESLESTINAEEMSDIFSKIIRSME